MGPWIPPDAFGPLSRGHRRWRGNFGELVLGGGGGGRPDYLQKLMVPEVLFQTWSSKTCIPESSLTGLARASLPEKVPKRENEFRGAVKHLN